MEAAVNILVNPLVDNQLYFDANGILNSNYLSSLHSLSEVDDFYFKVKAIANGVKLKKIIKGDDLVKMNQHSFFFFMKDSPRFYIAIGIVSLNPITRFLIWLRLREVNSKVPIRFFSTKSCATSWLNAL